MIHAAFSPRTEPQRTRGKERDGGEDRESEREKSERVIGTEGGKVRSRERSAKEKM